MHLNLEICIMFEHYGFVEQAIYMAELERKREEVNLIGGNYLEF